MVESSRRVWATIDSDALKKNLVIVSELCPNSKIFPVVKSNAYGHGVKKVVGALKKSDGFCVATI